MAVVEDDANTAGGIPTRMLRKVNVGELLDMARNYSVGIIDTAAQVEPLWTGLRRQVPVATDLARAGARPGRRGHGIEHYLLWADRYVQKIEAGSKRPVADLAEEHLEALGGDLEKAKIFVRDTVKDARNRHGLVTKPGQGRYGGQLTEKAKT